MARDICIVHIEDEFVQLKQFPSKLKDYVEGYWNEKDGGDNFTILSEVQRSNGSGEPAWLVYEIACPKQSSQKIRYIFVGPKEIPAEVEPYLLDRCHFIIDVLRPSNDAQKLWVTGDESIKSALRHGGSPETITIYTACQGSDLQALLAANPDVRMISKASVPQFNDLLSEIVYRSMDDG